MAQRLHDFNDFLKNFADKWYLFIVFVIVFGSWLVFRHDFTAQLSRDLVMAMLAIAGYKRATSEQSTAIEKTDTVNILPPAEQTDVPTENVGVETEKQV